MQIKDIDGKQYNIAAVYNIGTDTWFGLILYTFIISATFLISST